MGYQKYKKSVISWSVGLVFLILGVTFLLSYHTIFEAFLKMKLPLTARSELFPFWKDIPMPMYYKVYFFNMTNPEEFKTGDVKANLAEIGPFTFSLHWNKNKLSFNDNHTITFIENQKYIFLREESVGSLDTNITTINGPMATAGYLVKDRALWEKVIFSGVLVTLHEKLFTVKTVRELLFDGYPDYLTVIGRSFDPNLPDMKGNFSWFYGRNDTDDGVFNTETGKNDLTKANLIKQWNGKEELPFWYGPKCNQINESFNAELGPPLAKDQKTLSIFRADLCRSWSLSYDKKVKHDILNSLRFTAGSSVLANSTVNPENKCFEKPNKILPSGVVDISSCHGDAPIILSLPHFYLGDAILREKIDGMKPNKSLHEFYLDVDPTIGLTVHMAARVQINIQLQPIPGIRQFNGVPDTPFPVLWQEIVGVVTKDQAEMIYDLVYKPQFIMQLSAFIAIGVGGLIALIAATFALKVHCETKKDGETVESYFLKQSMQNNTAMFKALNIAEKPCMLVAAKSLPSCTHPPSAPFYCTVPLKPLHEAYAKTSAN